jgi:hypothetical protein
MGWNFYTNKNFMSYCSFVSTKICCNAKVLLILLIFLIPISEKVSAQDRYSDDIADATITYDEFQVLVRIEGFKDFYVDALYTSNGLLYLDVEEFFQTIGVPFEASQKGDSIAGFWGDKRLPLLIDYTKQQVKVGSKISHYRRGLIKESGTLYMESSLFANELGVEVNFNFRALLLKVKLGFEPPIIKQQRVENMRNNIARLKGEIVADTVMSRSYHLIKPGMLDWSIASSQKWNGNSYSNFSLGVGSELLYGQADFSVNQYTNQKFDDRNMYYLWRWADNDMKLVKQAQVGRIYNQTIAFINSPIIGTTIRNTPTTVRKAKGYFTINEVTDPNWIVELYINDVLIDYTKSDASGAYTFKVPLVYGYTRLRLKFYGPLGEERIEERTVNVPYTIVSKGEFEYGLSGGIIQDSVLSRFGRAEFNYGVNGFLTIGGGIEYLSSIPTGAYMPFVRATIQPFSKMILSGEYDHNVKTQGILNYYLWKDISLELDYTRYKEGQKATFISALEEKKIRILVPFKLGRVSLLSRFEYYQQVYNATDFNYANVMLSLYYRQFSVNSTTSFNWLSEESPYVVTNLALSYNIGKWFTFRPSYQADVTNFNILSYKFEIEKSFRKGYLSTSYQRNVHSRDDFISLNLKYDLNFSRTNLTVSRSQGSDYTSQSAQGSLAFGGGNGYVYASNNPSVGKGGIVVYPFLDLNQNGVFDKGERMVKLASVKIPGGKVIFSKKDSIVRITELNPFVDYMLEFDNNDLESLSWRFKHKTYKVTADPNQFKRVDVPIIVVGEANGMVTLNNNNTLKGIGRILVKIYRKGSSKVVAEMLSESDGYISYIGLAQGNYVACVDSTQLKRLNYTATPAQIPFTIRVVEDGDIVSSLNFLLNSNRNEEDTVKETTTFKLTSLSDNTTSDKKGAGLVKVEQENSKVPSSFNGYKESSVNPTLQKILGGNNPYTVVLSDQSFPKCSYYQQLGAFKSKSNALKYALSKKQEDVRNVGVVLHNGLYKVVVGYIQRSKNNGT